MPMRQLRSCDFCGAEATGVYEVLPPELSPTDAEQQRVVLCADCRETLEDVLAPLLARLGVGGEAADAVQGGADTVQRGTDASAATEGASGADPSDGREADHAGPGRDADPTDSFADDDPRGTGMSDPGREGIPDRRSGRDDAVDGSGDDEGGDGETGDGTDEEAEWETGTEAETATTAETGTETETGGEATAPTPPVGEEPAEFRTVMRLLGNREFPVRRDEVVEVATNAYDLGEDEVEEILAYAVQRGLLVDDGETVRRP